MKSFVVGVVVSVLLLKNEVQSAAAFFGRRSFATPLTKGRGVESDRPMSSSPSGCITLSERVSHWPPRGGDDEEGSPVVDGSTAEEEPEVLYMPGLVEVELSHSDHVGANG
jgi:hypothetical protein